MVTSYSGEFEVKNAIGILSISSERESCRESYNSTNSVCSPNSNLSSNYQNYPKKKKK